MDPKWLDWSKRLLAIAQNGLTFAADPFDKERYEQVQKIAAEIMASYSELDEEQILDLFQAEIGYATPKVDVRGAVFRDGRILLVRERANCLWTLPGGWVDIGDSPREAVVREVLEESGFDVHVTKLAAVYDRNKHDHPPLAYHIYKLFFICEVIGGEAKGSIETDAVDFFTEDDLPELSLPHVTPHQISRMFEHYRNHGLPTDFD